MEDPREVVQKRSQRVHHTEVLYSPWYGQDQSPTAPGFLQIAENVKLNWYLENKRFTSNLIHFFPPSASDGASWPVSQMGSWLASQCWSASQLAGQSVMTITASYCGLQQKMHLQNKLAHPVSYSKSFSHNYL